MTQAAEKKAGRQSGRETGSLLHVRDMTKIFGGLVALNEVDFNVDEGTVVGRVGPNRAGKTTVVNSINRNNVPPSGDNVFQGRRIRGKKPHKVVELGIARTFQAIRLFGNLSVLENVLAGRHCRLRSGLLSSLLHTPGQRLEEAEAVERCMEELRFVGLDHLWREEAGSLAYGSQRLLEISRALATDPKLLVLDEPAGGMNDQETAGLVEVIRAIRARGITVLLIEHDMRLVMQVCEKLVVLEHGNLIAQGDPASVRANPDVIEAYLGTDDSDEAY
ncbi:MAG: ABC transporter ATP-binding protein [Desulfovibrionaceae bacterium]|nr:ABC transporter ATP-binding protein [Desulfovibrionaceae bacterium]